MPVRLLKASLRTSERWHRCTYFVRCLYISLLNLVDDYGRYEANRKLLASECFPYGDENGMPMSEDQVDGGIRKLASEDLIVVYESEGKQYLEFTRWKEHIRQKESKYPDPAKCRIVWAVEQRMQSKCCASATQLLTSPPSPSPSPVPTPTPSPAASTRPAIAERVCVEKCAQPDPKDLAREIAAQKRPENGFTVFDLKTELCTLYKRDPRAPWAYEEERLAVSIAKRPECQKELAEINQFRAGLAEKKYFPNKLLRLLEDWTGTLDRARAGKNGIGPKLKDVIEFVKEKCPTDDRAANWAASFFGTWHRRGWMRKGVPIDWKVELSKQVATWGKEA